MSLFRPLIGQHLEICESFLSRHSRLWELILQPLGKSECLNNININFCNSPTLTVLPATAADRADL